MSVFEDVLTIPLGLGADGTPEHVTVLTGRMRRPATLEEWRAQRLAALAASVRVYPAARAVAALLEAGEDADVKAAGKPLSEWERAGTLAGLQSLEQSARSDFPPAAAVMSALVRRWIRRWGDGALLIPPAGVTVEPRRGRERAPILAETGTDAGRAGAAWTALGTARQRVRAAVLAGA